MIGFCYSEFSAPQNIQFDSEKENFPMQNFCFVGMAAIMDPPREDTAPAIAACKQAGIKVFMVTGTFRAQLCAAFAPRLQLYM